MKREVCKFFSGAFAALAYAHAAYAVATDRGVINEPVFLGRGGVSDTCGRRPLFTLQSAWHSDTSAGSPNLKNSYRSRRPLRRMGKVNNLPRQLNNLSPYPTD